MAPYVVSGSLGASAVPSISPGVSYQVWSASTVVAGSGLAAASQQVALTLSQGVSNGIGASGFFSAAPGAFEIDLQVSDADADSQYQTIQNGNITTVDSVNNTWHIDAPYVCAKFARLLLRSLTNVVTVTADIQQR